MMNRSKNIFSSRIGLICFSFVLSLALTQSITAEQHPISIDGDFSDWENVSLAYTDPLGDSTTSTDFGRIWLADDAEFLFIRLELNDEVDSSENNSLRLLIDADQDSSTGLPVSGIGAELEWIFGSRAGVFYVAGQAVPISGANISFRGGPTVTSICFEFAIGKQSLPDGINPLFVDSTIQIALVDDAGGDTVPDAGQHLSYQMDVGSPPKTEPISFDRFRSTDLRFLTHNVLFDNPWNPNLTQRFGRLWSVASPDILNLQEIYNHTLSETIQLVNQLLPPAEGETWYGAAHADCFTISKYPVLNSWNLAGNLAVLLDTSASIGGPCLIINGHLPCCANEGPRQAEADQIMAFIRESRTPDGPTSIPVGTPIVICGDLNLVGLARQLDTLLTGDIADNANFGSDFNPDWDDSAFTNLISRQTEKRMGYTWRNDNGSFWPGQLDFFIYSDSVFDLGNHYIIYTPEIADPPSHGLQSNDSFVSDHLVFVADFRATQTVLLGDINLDGVVDLLDVAPFIDVLNSMTYQAEADVNQDGIVNLLDVAPFVELF